MLVFPKRTNNRSVPMKLIFASVAAICLISSPTFAETEEDCRSRWRTADVDGNGALEAKVDAPEYVKMLNSSTPVSRDEFLKRCQSGAFAALAQPSSTAETKDLGKGDITPGPALTKEDASKKLKASGYGNVDDLKLDDKGVWRGTGVANGKSVSVAVDPQGDVLAQ
jgi:hypothetical protein